MGRPGSRCWRQPERLPHVRAPPSRRPRGGGAGPPAGRRLPRRRAVPRAPRSPLDRRQHLQGPRRQRARRARGGVRRHRAGEERLPARRRDRAAGRRGAAPRPRLGARGPPDHRHAQARAGDRGPGRQGSAEDEGRPAVDGPHDRRALHGLRALRRGRGRVPPAGRQGARAAAQGGREARSEGSRRDHPHRGAGRHARRPRARAAVPVQAQRGAAEARRGDDRAGARLPGGRPVGAGRARHLLTTFERAVVDDPKQHHRLVSFFSRTAPELVDHVELWEEDSRCSRRSGSRRCSTRRCRAGSICRAAAT